MMHNARQQSARRIIRFLAMSASIAIAAAAWMPYALNVSLAACAGRSSRITGNFSTGESDMNGKTLLKAHALINGDRLTDYGNPKTSLKRIAGMWSAYTGHKITGHDVACMMCLLKLARQSHCHKPDNLIDAAGYIGLAADLASEDLDDKSNNEGAI